MDTLQTAGQTQAPETFDSVNPATSEVIATFPVFGQAEVNAAVERAHEAAGWWAGLGWKARQARLLAWKSHLTRYVGRLAELVHNETGKPLDYARLEIVLAIVHIDWAAKHARKVLGPRRVRSGLTALSKVNKIAFTGSSPTARNVMAACAQNLTPMIAECGGKDALLVGPDANLDAAADAAAWGAVSNAGQTCIGVERVYVVDAVYHSFVEKLSERMS